MSEEINHAHVSAKPVSKEAESTTRNTKVTIDLAKHLDILDELDQKARDDERSRSQYLERFLVKSKGNL